VAIMAAVLRGVRLFDFCVSKNSLFGRNLREVLFPYFYTRLHRRCAHPNNAT